MKLYKYISFNKHYWWQPYSEGTLYFPTIPELRNINDPDEFKHSWNYQSFFFTKLSREMKGTYESLFRMTRVLCMATKLSAKLWNEYCGTNGGICYEFDFESDKVPKDVTHREITYVSKINNDIPSHIINNSPKHISQLIKNPILKYEEFLVLKDYNESGKMTDLMTKQILNEMTFKKIKKYSYESEYRFVQPDKKAYPSQNMHTFLDNGKLSYSILGLSLNQIHTNLTGALKLDPVIKFNNFPKSK